MKKIFCFLVFFSFFISGACALELEGGVKYTVDSAREYVQQGQVDSIEVTGPYELQLENTEKVVYSYNNAGMVIGITVQYVGEPNKAYIYGRDKTLTYIDKYDKPVSVFPHRGYRYDMHGKLNLTSLSVSENEHFRFSPEGELIAHSINGITYDENGSVIGTSKE